MESWISPDKKIEKRILTLGELGTKPYEESECKINILECPEILAKYNNTMLVVGDNDGDLGRALDICLGTMYLRERSKFTLHLEETISIVIELQDLIFGGFVFEWDAKKKYNIALKHKNKGVQYFNEKNNIEAAYRFTKALKIVSLIPMDVETLPKIIDGVVMDDIKKLKETLYNNLSSCYFKNECYNIVIDLCNKVLSFDTDNVKALYKIGVAYEKDKDFENAHKMLSKLAELEPHNKACAEHLTYIRSQLKAADVRVNNIIKKMISGTIHN